MPSVLELVHLPTNGNGGEPGINDLAREAKIKGRGSMSKADKICALSDEALSSEAEQIVKASSGDLIDRARTEDVKGYSTMSKSELQEHFLRSMGVASSRPAGTDREGFGAEDDDYMPAPTGPVDSHFDSEEERRHAIHDAAHEALDAALNEKQSYIVVESRRRSDASDPLRIQPSYIQRHENTEVVLEIMVPHYMHRR
jgi:hypothetical protein